MFTSFKNSAKTDQAVFRNLLVLNIKNQNHSVMDNRFRKTSLRICQISGEFCELLGMLLEDGLQKIPKHNYCQSVSLLLHIHLSKFLNIPVVHIK